MNVFKTPINRRQLFRGGAALGVTTLVPSFLLSACGGTDGTDGTTGVGGLQGAPARETRALNFDFSASPVNAPRLQLANSAQDGAALLVHTSESRTAQRKANPALSAIPDANLTHYLPDVDVPAGALQSGSVLGKHPKTGADVLILHFLHVPTSALTAVAAKRANKPLVDMQPPALRQKLGAVNTPTLLPSVIGQYSAPTAVALSLVFQHPAIMNLDPNLGGDIVDRINTLPTADSPYLSTLAFKISDLIQTGGWPSTTSTGSWAVMVPRVDSDGQPVLDDDGNQVYSYTVNTALNDTLAMVVKAILNNINSDADFEGTNWQPSVGAPQQTVVAAAVAAAWGSPSQGVGDSSFTVQHSLKLGSRTSGIRFKKIEATEDRVVTVTVANEFLRSAGAYVEFRDANDATLPVANPVDHIDTGRAKYVCMISPDVQIMGIPFLGDTTPTTSVSFTMPDDATKAILYYGGLGIGGTDAFHGEAMLGTVSTLVLNIGLPLVCLGLGIFSSDAKTISAAIEEVLKDPITLKTIAKGVVDALAGGLGSSIQTATTTLSFSAIAAGVGETVLDIFLECAPRISTLIAAKVSEGMVKKSLPMVGEALWALSTIADIAAMGETAIECLSVPCIDSNTISLGMDQAVSISHDPSDYEFPATATKVVVVATYDGAKSANVVEAAVTKGLGQLNVPLGNVASGGLVFAEATFYDQNDTIVGYGKSAVLNNLPDSAGTIPLTITELLVPLSASTSYQHANKLVYENGAHAWQQTASAPSQTISSLKPGADGVLTALYGVTVHTPTGNAGYAFAAGGQGIGVCGNGSSSSPAGLRNVFLGDNPDSLAKFSSCGATQPMGICYDPHGIQTRGGNDFFLQPGGDGFYHLRGVSLDNTNFDMNQGLSWGRFSYPQDSLCVLSNGFVIGCNRDTHRMEVLRLAQAPSTPGDESDAVPFSALKAGYGSQQGFLDTPVAVAALNDKVLILEQGNKRVQAFDQDGSAISLFAGSEGSNSTPILTLKDDGTTTTYLDIAVEGKGYVYVLSYSNAGSSASDYHIDVYTPDGSWLTRTSGVAAGALAVDLFRNVVTLNYEPIAGAPQVEPSLSQWLPQGSTASSARVRKAVQA